MNPKAASGIAANIREIAIAAAKIAVIDSGVSPVPMRAAAARAQHAADIEKAGDRIAEWLMQPMTFARGRQSKDGRVSTPAPWFVVSGGVWTTPNGPDDGGKCVAIRASGETKISPTEKDSNMHVIAAAPDALELCRALVAYYHAYPPTAGNTSELQLIDDMRDRAEAALAKAQS